MGLNAHERSSSVIAKAHLEAGKAWELGATEAEMKDILQDIRHARGRKPESQNGA